MSKLKRIRETVGYSQSQLAVASDVSLRMIQQYEQGTKNIDGAKLGTLSKLATSLGCKIIDLIESEELVEFIRQNEVRLRK